jgi:hypothetical protein
MVRAKRQRLGENRGRYRREALIHVPRDGHDTHVPKTVSRNPRKEPMSTGDDTMAQPRFQHGDRVRVKPGVRDYNYPDLPIGGWAGEIVEIDLDNEGRDFRVDWSIATLENMHRIYIERCERDDLDESTMWLAVDQLETDDGTPATVEPPLLPEWARHAGDEQLAVIFGLGKDDPIPDTDIVWLAKYHEFLVAHLTLPFEALWEDDPLMVVRVFELLPPTEATVEADDGLNCMIEGGEVVESVPLALLYVSNEHPNFQLLTDYRHWIAGGEDDWDDDDGEWGDEIYQDDEYGPNDDVGQMFRATMEGLRSHRDILGELPNQEELRRVQALAGELVLSDVDPELDAEPEADAYEGPQPLRKSGPAVGRNDPCPCGSGKKYKKCCLKQRE